MTRGPRLTFFFAPVVSVAVLGCTAEVATDPAVSADGPMAEPVAVSASDAAAERFGPLTADDVAGRWQFVMYGDSNDLNAGFVTLGTPGDDAGVAVEAFDATELFQGSTVEQCRFEGETLLMTFRFGKPEDAPQDFVPPTYTFTGRRLPDGVVYGHMLFPNYNAEPVRLKRVPPGAVINEATLAKVMIGPTKGRLAAQTAFTAADPIAAYTELASAETPSAAVGDSIKRLLENSGLIANADEERVRGLTDAYVAAEEKWGEAPGLVARMVCAFSLKKNGVHDGLADELADETLSRVPDFVAQEWGRLIEIGELQGRIAIARRQADAALKKVADDPAAALAMFESIPEEFVLDPHVLYRSAEVAEAAGDRDAAIENFGTLLAVPGLAAEVDRLPIRESLDYTPPAGRITELWLEANSSLDGLEAYVNEIYDGLVFDLVEQAGGPEVADGRELRPGQAGRLLELFTGQSCPPCVAADIATEALESRPRTSADLIVLRYHVHIPGPDQLATASSVDRMGYYEIPGTPTLFVDGAASQTGVPGPYPRSGLVYAGLAAEVLGVDPPAAPIELVATAGDGVVYISARADAADLPEQTRLRVVLAEREIDFQAGNGIRRHHMIARAMPGGSDGVAAAEGTLAIEETVSLADVRAEIDAHLDEIERQLTNDEYLFKFNGRPQDLDDLAVVAFLQDDATKAVLGTAVVAVDMTTPDADDASPET
ncbi:MAG: hypothetical protein AAGJ97_07405 [Planctomycetota bacterium]